jgi:hypothetical protein
MKIIPAASVPENLCAGHNQRLKMEVTRKEERVENKEVKRPEAIFRAMKQPLS